MPTKQTLQEIVMPELDFTDKQASAANIVAILYPLFFSKTLQEDQALKASFDYAHRILDGVKKEF